MSDQVARLCFDGASKFPVYVMPNLEKMVRDDKDLIRVAYLFAAYRHYLKYHTDDNGEQFEVADPWLTADDQQLIASDEPLDFLALSPFRSTDLRAAENFTQPYLRMVESIKSKGAMKTLEDIL